MGVDMDANRIRAELDKCLLTDQEMAGGPEHWAREMTDLLPPWEDELLGDEEGDDVYDDRDLR